MTNTGDGGDLSGWVPIAGPDRARMLEDLERHLENPLPEDVELYRREAPCYEVHQLVRVRLPGPFGIRESYMLYAPEDPVPMDWTSAPIHDLNERALRITDAATAEEYLRLFCFAIAGDEGRFFIVESVDDLRLRPGETLDEQTSTRLSTALYTVTRIDTEDEEEDGPRQYRFKAPILYGDALFDATFLVDRDGMVEMIDDVPVASDLPVIPDELGSDRYFVLVRADGPGLLPEDFLARIREGTPVSEVRVLGNVDAAGETFEKPIVVTSTTFNGDVTFEGARFRCPVRFDRCTFRGTVDLREVRSTSSLIGRRLVIGEDAVAKPGGGAALRAAALRVEGMLDLRGTSVRGGIDLAGARIDATLHLGGVDIDDWSPDAWEVDPALAPTVLALAGATIGGDVDFVSRDAGHTPRATPADRRTADGIPGYGEAVAVVRGMIDASRIRISGMLWMGGLRCHGDARFDLAILEGGLLADPVGRARFICLGTVALPFSKIRGNVSIAGVHVQEELQLFMAHVDGSVFARCNPWSAARPLHAVVRGDFDVSGIEANDVELEGAELGSVRVITGDIGRLRLMPGLEAVNEEDGERWKLRPCRTGSLIVQTAKIRDAATFSHLHVRPPREDGAPSLVAGLAELLHVECGGSIQFWNPRLLLSMSSLPESHRWAGGREPDPYAVESKFPGDLELRGVKTTGELSLVNVRAAGKILVNDCHVGHDLDLGSHGADPSSRDGQTTTVCRGLELEATVCGGDADLTGLRAIGPEPEVGAIESPPAADVLARRLRVAGKLVFSRPLGPDREAFDSLSPKPEERIDAKISGRLDLSVGEASHLIISGHSFQDERRERGISFERGRFRRFQVVSPFPQCHDSSDLEVERWEIPDRFLLGFLKKSSPFRRSTYVGVERVLRNDGNDELADEVYREMRRKILEDSTPDAASDPDAAGTPGDAPVRRGWLQRTSFQLRRQASWFIGRTIGWGTQNLKPLVFAALVFPLSVWVFSSPDNVAPSSELLEIAADLEESSRPPDHGVEWGTGDGIWMALRYQIPVVPIGARERWQPSSDPIRLELPASDRAIDLYWISPEDFAFIVFLIHWVIWPLVLIGVTSKVIRERA